MLEIFCSYFTAIVSTALVDPTRSRSTSMDWSFCFRRVSNSVLIVELASIILELASIRIELAFMRATICSFMSKAIPLTRRVVARDEEHSWHFSLLEEVIVVCVMWRKEEWGGVGVGVLCGGVVESESMGAWCIKKINRG